MSDVKELNINNTTYDIKAKSVVDTNSGKLEFWSGTRQEYDAIVTKDANTLYICTNGEIYLGTTLISNDGANKSLSNLDATGQAVIDGKADVDLTNCTKPHIVEAYVNGTSGYNLYSNGYCEQWGSLPSGTSVTYLKTFRDTNYICQVQIINPDSTTATNEGAWIIKSLSTTGFTKITTGSQYLPSGTWKACGYLA